MGLICLDLDNTLINSDKAHATAYNYALKRMGLRQHTQKYISSLFGGPKLEVAEKLIPGCSQKDFIQLLYLHDQRMVRKTSSYARRIPGAIMTLKKLKQKYKLALVSNCHHSSMLDLLKRTNIDKSYFDILIGSDEVRHSKPQPDEILLAEKLLKQKAELMVGDSIYDVMAGNKAKVPVIAVLTGNYSRSDLKRYKPLKIIKSIKELPELLEKIKL